MVTYDSKVVTFLSGCNTIIIQNIVEFSQFVNMLGKIGINAYRPLKDVCNTYPMMLEYNNGKGFALWKTEDYNESKDWFGMEPFVWDDIRKELA